MEIPLEDLNPTAEIVPVDVQTPSDAPEIIVETSPQMSSAELFDLDERGLGEDVPFHTRKITAETDEIPKEILVAAAATTGGISITIIIIIIIALVLGLGIGLGVGAGVGVGLGIGLNACPTPNVRSTSISHPFCFDATTSSRPLDIFGTNFYQAVDRNGRILSNPTLSLTLADTTEVSLNLTQNVADSLCGSDRCQVMNTTGVNSAQFRFSSNGLGKITLKVANREGCLIQTTSDTDIFGMNLGYTSYAPFCISPTPGDPRFNPILSVTGQGFTFDPSNAANRPSVVIAGTSYPATNFSSCDDGTTLGSTFKTCRNMQVTLTGSTFPTYTNNPMTITHTGIGQSCSVSSTVFAPTYSTVTGFTINPVCYTTTPGQTAEAIITGTGFFSGTTVFLVSATGVRSQATSFTLVSATEIKARFSATLPVGVHTLAIDNIGCFRTYSGFTLEYLPPYQVFMVEPSAVLATYQNTIDVWTTGSRVNPGTIVLSSDAGTIDVSGSLNTQGTNKFRLNLGVGAITAPARWFLTVTNGDGCVATAHPDGNAHITTSGTTIPAFTVSPSIIDGAVTTQITLTGSGFLSNPMVYVAPNGPPGAITRLLGVERVSGTVVRAYVPENELASGSYDVIVVNTDGTTALVANGLTVQSVPTPWIRTMTPENFGLGLGSYGIINGENFLNPNITFTCGSTEYGGFSIISATPTTIEFSIRTNNVPANSYCTVNIINSGIMRGVTYHGFSVHTAIGTRSTPSAANLAQSRIEHAATMFNTRSGTRYMAVLGGRAGTSNPVIAANNANFMELAIFNGGLTFQPFSAATTEGQVGVTVSGGNLESLGDFLYLTGGEASTTVRRLQILDPQVVPTIVSHSLTFENITGQSYMPSGNWWYAISAVYDSNDDVNPGGETFVGRGHMVRIPFPSLSNLNSGFKVTITWNSVPDAVSYNIWRTTSPDLASTSINFVTNVVATTTWTDQNNIIPVGGRIRPSLFGKWKTLAATTTVVRRNSGSIMTPTPSGNDTFLWYLGGGTSRTGFGGTGGSYWNTFEFLNITVTRKATPLDREKHAIGNFITGSSALTISTTHTEYAKINSVTAFDSPNVLAGQIWLYFGSGNEFDGDRSNLISAFRIAADGQPAAAPTSTGIGDLTNSNSGVTGYCWFKWSGALYRFGGDQNPNYVNAVQFLTIDTPVPTTVQGGDPSTAAISLSGPTTRARMACVQGAGYSFVISGWTAANTYSAQTDIGML